MDLAIIGLPQVGKRTIFTILTGMDPTRAPRRDGCIHGLAPVRDPRIDTLVVLYEPRRWRYAEFGVVLAPDIEPGAGTDRDWLEAIRGADALLHVVRSFESDHVFHVAGTVDPERDRDTVHAELLLADLALIETRLERMAKDTRKDVRAQRNHEEALLRRCSEHLEAENPLSTLACSRDDLRQLASLQLLTLKPLVTVLNTNENVHLAPSDVPLVPDSAACAEKGTATVALCASIEVELAELDPEDQVDFMRELGVHEPGVHRLSRAAYEALGLLSFFTVGKDEVRAWSIPSGAKAPEAAGQIHSDLQRGFIRAETIAYQELIAAGSEEAARAAKSYRMNGKDYTVRDGDVMEILFSV